MQPCLPACIGMITPLALTALQGPWGWFLSLPACIGMITPRLLLLPPSGLFSYWNKYFPTDVASSSTSMLVSPPQVLPCWRRLPLSMLRHSPSCCCSCSITSRCAVAAVASLPVLPLQLLRHSPSCCCSCCITPRPAVAASRAAAVAQPGQPGAGASSCTHKRVTE